MSKRAGAIESLLLVAGKPLSFEAIAKLLECPASEVRATVDELSQEYNAKERGIHVMVNGGKVQLTTNPDYKKLIADFVKDETTGELTKPSLETLTIIAYRQPITKEALEQIRGVHCSLILRNLMIRGLIETKEERGGLSATYSVTMDFLRFLGVNRVEELPNFEKLHSDESIAALLERNVEKQEKNPSGENV